MGKILEGPRHVLRIGDEDYPEMLFDCRNQPEELYLIGDPRALSPGLAIVGARKATPYGLTHAEHFASIAASRGIPIISGGALGCDSAAHRGALAAGGKTVAVLGGGCDRLYPSRNRALYQEIIDNGGAVVSEHSWEEEPFGWRFRERNRMIAGLAAATLIIEAGLPSGTFSTADEALSAGREVLSLPGAITSRQSHGSNQLIFQGAMPVIDDESFICELDALFPNSKPGLLDAGDVQQEEASPDETGLMDALAAQPLSVEEIKGLMDNASKGEVSIGDAMMRISMLESSGMIARYPDGRYGPIKVSRRKSTAREQRIVG